MGTRSKLTQKTTTDRRISARLDNEDGIGLLAALLVMLLISTMGAAMMLVGMTDMGTSENYRASKVALYEADSGLQQSIADFLSDPNWIIAVVSPTLPVTAIDPFPLVLTINGHTFVVSTDGSGNPVPEYYPWGGTVTLGDGTFTRSVMMPPSAFQIANGKGSKAWVSFPIRSVGTGGLSEPSNQIVEADGRVLVHRIAVWDNALFAGTGQGGRQINGNVEIRGSMHIVGDPSSPTLLDWGGGSGVINNYENAADNQNFGADAWKLPILPTRMFEGDLVETLDSEVRVNHGTLNLSGTADVGEAHVSGNRSKETVDGVYTSNPVVTSGSGEVFADAAGDYDVAVTIPFPTLDDPYTDPATGNTYAHHRDFLNTQSLTIPHQQIDEGTASFNMSDGLGNWIDWDQSTQTLTVNGVIRVDGDITIGDNGGNDRRLTYAGTGTIYATDDIEVLWDMVPVGEYLDDSQALVHNLGLIADDDMAIATTSQLEIFAAIYAEDQITFAKQTVIAGAAVANYFDMGQNVPSLWQVPKLSGMLPPGMPGATPMVYPNQVQMANWTHVR